MIADDERRVWRKSLKYGAIHASLAFVDHRLELGAGILLGWLAHYEGAEPFLAFEGGEERALALLSIAYQRPFTRRALDNLRRGARAWIEGEACLAHIHFAHGGIRSLEQPEEDAWRLELADRVLKSPRFTPRALMKAIGCEAPWDHEFAKANFNSAEARVPKGSGEGSGDWTSGGGGGGGGGGSGSSASGTNSSASNPTEYKRGPNTPRDTISVKRNDGSPVTDPSSPTGILLAPPRADYKKIYAAGRSIRHLSIPEQKPIAREAIAQGGTYDFQREKSTMTFFPAYTNASNYAVGVYMAGAGHWETATLAIAEYYALRHSSNFGSMDQIAWIARGWQDAHAGYWKETRR